MVWSVSLHFLRWLTSTMRPIAAMPARWLHAQKQTSYMVNIVF